MDICFGTNAKPLSTHTYIYIYKYRTCLWLLPWWSSMLLIIILIIVMYHLPKNMINTVTALIFITSPSRLANFAWFSRPNFTAVLDHKDLGDFPRSHSEIHDFLHATLGGKWLNMLAWFLGNFGSSRLASFAPGFLRFLLLIEFVKLIHQMLVLIQATRHPCDRQDGSLGQKLRQKANWNIARLL